MTDLNAIAVELGELGRADFALLHQLRRHNDELIARLEVHRERRCTVLKTLLAHMVATGQVSEGSVQASTQKDPPPNPGGG